MELTNGCYLLYCVLYEYIVILFSVVNIGQQDVIRLVLTKNMMSLSYLH